MIFNHRVKRNGVYYEAGQDVPMDDERKESLKTDQTFEEDQTSESTFLEDEVATPKRGRPKKTE